LARLRLPSENCRRCPRLVTLRGQCRAAHPDWHNAPVAALGPLDARLLIAGLAPGRQGANRTGRPFTGDAAGGYLFAMMQRHGLVSGNYHPDARDDILLHDARITNVVRCLPPSNKPVAAEVNACRPFLLSELRAMPNLDTILTLGRVAHDALCRTLGLNPSSVPFGHGNIWSGDVDWSGRFARSGTRHLRIVSSYHCSRYNTQTGRLTDAMFSNVFKAVKDGWPEPEAPGA